MASASMSGGGNNEVANNNNNNGNMQQQQQQQQPEESIEFLQREIEHLKRRIVEERFKLGDKSMIQVWEPVINRQSLEKNNIG